MKLNKQLKDISVYQPGKPIEEVKKELGLNEVIKLASNENPFGQSKKIKQRIEKEVDFLHIYPDSTGIELRKKISDLYSIDTEQIILGNGSDEIIQYIARAYLNNDTEVIMADITFPMYKLNAMIESAKIIEVPLINGRHDLNKMAERITSKTAIVWVCNPNNPTGTIITHEELIDFLEKVPSEVLVVMDEAYAEYVVDPNYPNTLELIELYPNLMLLRTFSKIYGLAALRIGYGIANKTIIEDLSKVKEPFNANRLAQSSAEEAVLDQEFIAYCQMENHKNKLFFMQELDKLGIEYFPSQTNFILIKINGDDQHVFEQLLQNGIITRPGSKLGLPGSLRITIGTMVQMEKLVKTLKAI